MSTVEATRYTPDDLLEMPDGERYELVDGQLVERPMGAEADWVAVELVTLLRNHVVQRKLGYVFGSSTGYQCFRDDRRKLRRPDGSFIATGRLPGNRIPKGHIKIAPDLVIESLSPRDIYYQVDAKIHEYLDAGVRLIWVVNPDNRTVKVYAAGSTSPTELSDGDELTGDDVLPGFRCAVTELFPTPADDDA
jgi:Uma2 family endonuclease